MRQRLAAGLVLLAFGSAVAAAEPKAKSEADALFAPGKILTFHLKVSAEDWDAMQPKGGGMRFGMPGPGKPPAGPADKPAAPAPAPARPPGGVPGKFGYEFPYVKGILEFDGKTIKDIGIRFKGNSSYMMSSRGLKRPFKLDFDRFVEGQKFCGLTMLNLANNAMDTTQLRETLAYHVFRAAGVPAPRTAFVRLHLTVTGKHDNQFVGLYTLIEEVNSPFLKDRLGEGKGLLLKPEGIQGLPYFGEDWASYKDRYQPKKDPSPEAERRLIAFTKLINNADDATFRKEIASYLDMEAFLRFLAVNSLLTNLDSFVGLGHNYYLYLHPKTNKFVFLPWDLNHAFGAFTMMGSADQLADWSIRTPYTGRNRLVERVLAMKENEEAYRVTLRKLTATVFTEEKLHPEIEAMEKLIREAVEQEARAARAAGPAFPGGGAPGGGMFGQLPSLKTFVTKRSTSVVAQLDGKSEGQVLRGMGFGPGGGRPGGPGGGFGGFGPGNMLAVRLLDAADGGKDRKLSLEETKGVIERFFKDCDKDGKGAVNEKTLVEAFDRLLPPPPGFGGGARPGGFRPPSLGTGIAAAVLRTADADKDGQVSLKEVLAAADKLFKEWDAGKDGTLDEKELIEGINRLMPPPQGFGPPPGAGGPPRPGEGTPGRVPPEAPKPEAPRKEGER